MCPVPRSRDIECLNPHIHLKSQAQPPKTNMDSTTDHYILGTVQAANIRHFSKNCYYHILAITSVVKIKAECLIQNTCYISQSEWHLRQSNPHASAGYRW